MQSLTQRVTTCDLLRKKTRTCKGVREGAKEREIEEAVSKDVASMPHSGNKGVLEVWPCGYVLASKV